MSSWLALIVVVASALHFLAGNVADPDLWAHVLHGQIMLEIHQLPRHDMFSYTAAGGAWHNHEWLAEVVLAAFYSTSGAAGLILLKLVISAGMLLLILDAARTLRNLFLVDHPLNPLSLAAALITAVAVISPGATFRPQLFTMLFLAAEVALLLRADLRLRRERIVVPWQLVMVPVLLVPWVNSHGGFLVGLGVLGIYAAASCGSVLAHLLAARRLGVPAEISPRQAAAIAAVGLAGAAAPLINPYGVGTYLFLASTLEMHGEISEWHPIAVFSAEFLRFKLMVLAIAAGLVIFGGATIRARRAMAVLAWQVTSLAVMAAYAMRHQRHTVLFAIAAAPMLVVVAEYVRLLVLARWPALRPRPPVFAAIACGMLIIAGVQIGGFAANLARDGVAIRFGRLDYPVDAVEFLRRNGIRGNIAMPFEWGSYAVWKLAPESRVFIDGRFETVYPTRVIEDYFAFMHGTPGWERLLEEYPTDIVVVQRRRQIHPRLFARRDLEYVYSDPAALVFVRRTPATRDALERLAQVADRASFERPPTVFP